MDELTSVGPRPSAAPMHNAPRADEFVRNWRYLFAAIVGLASGATLYQYLGALFAPQLLREFGWSKSQFALIGTTVIVSIVSLPLAGRMSDVFGVRRVAAVGVIASPLFFLALAAMHGSFAYFFLATLAQVVFVGGTTSAPILSRLVAESFDRRRGAALALVACAAPLAAALATPAMARLIDQHGWRAGYLVLAAATAVGGAIALLLIPAHRRADHRQGEPAMASVRSDYAAILRTPAFRIIALAMLCCNVTLTVQASQLKLILLGNGMTSDAASWLISLYAIGTLAGRLACGFALDRFPPHIVATIGLGMPAAGLLMLASGAPSAALMALAVLIVGLALGAELDIAGYLVMRYFRLRVYGSVCSLFSAMAALSASAGSILLSVMLSAGGNYRMFLLLSAVLTFAGSMTLLRLRRHAPL